MSKMTKQRKYAIVGAILAACIVGGAVGAQLYLSITFDGMQWTMASSQIKFSATYIHGGNPRWCADFNFTSGVISGIDSQTFDCDLPWYPDLEVYYKELVAIERKDQTLETGEGALDLTWTGENVTDTSGLILLEVYAFRNEMESTTTTLIGHWDTTTGEFVLDSDMDFIEYGVSGGGSHWIVVGIRAVWASNPQPVTFSIGCIAA